MAKKKKMGYKQGGVVGTSEYSQSAYQKGGVVGTPEYSKKYKKGGITKPKYEDGGLVKRKGWSDKKGSKVSYKNSADQSYDGKAYGSRKGWGDKKESRIGYSQRGGSAQNSEKFKKRRGYSDHEVEHAYQDGGLVGEAKRSALMGLKSQMMELGGNSLFDSIDNPDAYKNGGVIKASVTAKDEEGLKEGLKKASKMMGKYEDGGIVESHDEEFDSEDSGSAYDSLSKEELIRLLKNS